MEKLAFALDIDGEWPPVAVEHVWCERTGLLYQLKNARFFIKGLAAGDRFSASPDEVNGCIFEFTVEESSGHSLVWVLQHDGPEFEPYKQELMHLGCSVEHFPAFQLHAVDVPASVENAAVNATVDKLDSLGFALAFPVWRH